MNSASRKPHERASANKTVPFGANPGVAEPCTEVGDGLVAGDVIGWREISVGAGIKQLKPAVTKVPEHVDHDRLQWRSWEVVIL